MFPPFSGDWGTVGADKQIPHCCISGDSFFFKQTFLAFFPLLDSTVDGNRKHGRKRENDWELNTAEVPGLQLTWRTCILNSETII